MAKGRSGAGGGGRSRQQAGRSEATKAALERRTWELTERVKELRCLHGISRLRERPNITLDEFLGELVELIPPAWQFPDVAAARIRVGDEIYATCNWREGPLTQRSEIQADGQLVVSVEVCYVERLPQMGAEAFLPEERSLIDSIAERIRNAVAHFRAAERVALYQTQLRTLASELAIAGERERRRIAQELHNQIGHSLASAKFNLARLLKHDAVRKAIPAAQLEEVLKPLDRAIQVSRDLTFELSPPVLHELGLGAALEWLVHQIRAQYGIASEYEDDRQPKPLREELRVELFQAMRELLANVGKHSRATVARVRCGVVGRQLRLEVQDDGVGFEPSRLRAPRDSADGWGLFSLRERLAHLGACLEVDSAPGKGTRVTILAPLSKEGEVRPAVPKGERAAAAARKPITILLAEDQALTRAGLRSLLEQEPDLEVLAEAADGEQALELCRKKRPDVVVMDIAMPEMDGIEATRRILAELPETRVIGLSIHTDRQKVLEMLRAGASGYLLKDCAREDLARAIRIVDAKLTFLSPGLATEAAADLVKGAPAAALSSAAEAGALTPREVEVLKLLAKGQHTKAAAAALAVSPKTIEAHRQHIMGKLGMGSIAELTRYAIRHGLVALDE